MGNACGKTLSQEGDRRLVESLRAARLRLFDTPTADTLRRLFGERCLVNGAPQRRDETAGRDFESDGGFVGRNANLAATTYMTPALMTAAYRINRVGSGVGATVAIVDA